MRQTFKEQGEHSALEFTQFHKSIKITWTFFDEKFWSTFYYEEFSEQVKDNFQSISDIFQAFRNSRQSLLGPRIDGAVLLVRVLSKVTAKQVVDVPVKLYLFQEREGEELSQGEVNIIKENMKLEWRQEFNRELLSELKQEVGNSFRVLREEIREVKRVLQEERMERKETKKDKAGRVYDKEAVFDEAFNHFNGMERKVKEEKQAVKIDWEVERIPNKMADEFDEEMNRFEEEMQAWRKGLAEVFQKYPEMNYCYLANGIYRGETKNGKPHGWGLFKWKNERFEAEWKNGRINGKAYQQWEHLYQYCEYEEGLRHGRQIAHDISGKCYMFRNQNGYRHGKYRLYKADGTLTKGEYKYDKIQGVSETYSIDGTQEKKETQGNQI